jgi:hypothetical protein
MKEKMLDLPIVEYLKCRRFGLSGMDTDVSIFTTSPPVVTETEGSFYLTLTICISTAECLNVLADLPHITIPVFLARWFASPLQDILRSISVKATLALVAEGEMERLYPYPPGIVFLEIYAEASERVALEFPHMMLVPFIEQALSASNWEVIPL